MQHHQQQRIIHICSHHYGQAHSNRMDRVVAHAYSNESRIGRSSVVGWHQIKSNEIAKILSCDCSKHTTLTKKSSNFYDYFMRMWCGGACA